MTFRKEKLTKLALIVTLVPIGVAVWCLPNRQYFRNTTAESTLAKVIIVRVFKPDSQIGECATGDPVLIRNLVKATQEGVFRQIGPFPRSFGDEAGHLFLYVQDKSGIEVVWGCQFDWHDFKSGAYSSNFVDAINAISERNETLSSVENKFAKDSRGILRYLPGEFPKGKK